MGKADEFRAKLTGNIGESIGVRGAGPVVPTPAARPVDPKFRGVKRSADSYEIPPSQIAPDPDQPRKEFDEEGLRRLSRSLLRHGQLQAIQARWDAGRGLWIIVSGERRYRAAVQAGLEWIKVKEWAKGEAIVRTDQLVENLLRQDLRPIEEARAFAQAMEENGWDGARLAEEIEVSPAKVSTALALLALPAEVQTRVEAGSISATAAYELTKIRDPEARAEMVGRILEGGVVTRDQIKEEVRAVVGRERPAPEPGPGPAPRRRGRPPGGDRWTKTIDGYSIEVKRPGFDRLSAAAALHAAARELEDLAASAA